MRSILSVICGVLLLLGQAQAARQLKGASGTVVASGSHGLGDSLGRRLMQRVGGRSLRQVGSAGWTGSTYHQPRDYRLINQLPFSSHAMQGNMMMAAGYRGSAAAASSFDSAMYYGPGYGAGGMAYGDPYGGYGGYGITRGPYDAAFAMTRANAINTRLQSGAPYDI